MWGWFPAARCANHRWPRRLRAAAHARVHLKSLIELWNPANSASETSWFGIGPPFIIAVAFLVGGVLVMIVSQFIQPGFFHRKLETAETMTPTPEGVIFND